MLSCGSIRVKSGATVSKIRVRGKRDEAAEFGILAALPAIVPGKPDIMEDGLRQHETPRRDADGLVGGFLAFFSGCGGFLE